MQYDFWTTPLYSTLKDRRPDIWESDWFQRWLVFYKAGTFDKLMTWILMSNLMLVVIESSYDINGMEEPGILQDLELWYALIYVSEVCCKLSVEAWSEYTSFNSNKFDFMTTWLLLASSIADLLLEGNTSAEVKRYMNILRLLRLLRVMKQLKNFKTFTRMVETVYRLVLASTDILTLLGVVVFFFTTLSVQLWGGLLYHGNPALEETEYVESKYFVFNFNDVPMAFGAWFVILLCEYVPLMSDAICAVSKYPSTWWIFVIFYVFAVSVIFELVKAFTIEIFMSINKKMKDIDSGKRTDGVFEPIEQLKKEFKEDGLNLNYAIIGDENIQDRIVEALKELQEDMDSDDEDDEDEDEEDRSQWSPQMTHRTMDSHR